MYNNTYERPRTQIEKCEHLARMKFENPIEKAQRERDERVYRFSSIDEAIGVEVAAHDGCHRAPPGADLSRRADAAGVVALIQQEATVVVNAQKVISAV